MTPGLVPEKKILAYLCYAVGGEEQPRQVLSPYIIYSTYFYEMILRYTFLLLVLLM